MTIPQIDRYFLSLERDSKNGLTVINTRCGDSRNNPRPFIVVLSHDDISICDKVLGKFTNIYDVMEYIRIYLYTHPDTGYFYC